MALPQIMIDDDGSLMSQDSINKFYQNGAKGIYPQLKKGLGIVDNMPMDAPTDASIVPPQNNDGFVMNNGAEAPNGLGMNNQNPVVAYDQSQDYNQTPLQGGQRKNGIDWRSVASYIGAFGDSANGNNISERINNGMGGVTNHMRDINTYNAYRPYYNQMGVDTTFLDPRYGGSGYGTIKPENIINLQDTLLNRQLLNELRRSQIDVNNAKLGDVNSLANGKTVTLGTLMKISPAFKQSIQNQYDFSNGQNQELLDTPLPSELVQTWLPAKKVNMNYSGGTSKNITKSGTTNINYTGGTNSTKTNYGAKYPNPNESPYKEGQTATNSKTGEKMIFKGGKWHQI